MSSQTMAIRSVIVGLVLGALATFLTFRHQIGLGAALFSLAVLAAIILFARLHDTAPIRRNLILLIPTVFFVGMLVVRTDRSLTAINMGASVACFALFVYYFRNGNILKLGTLDYPLKGMLSAILITKQPIHELKESRRWLTSHREAWPRIGPVVRGGAITIPVAGVFIVLLSAADEVFARLVHDVLNTFSFQNTSNLSQQVLYTGLFAWVGIGALAVSLIERKTKRDVQHAESESASEEVPVAKIPLRRFRLGFTEAVMVLASICTVFAAFVMIQLVYLFGGQHNIASYTYAAYVHRGFIELVLVALLTLGLVLTLNTVTIRKPTLQNNVMRGLSSVLVILTAVILASAFQRLRLYELTYGFTALRLTIYVFIAWLGFTFTGFLLSLYWQPRSVNLFAVSALVAVLGFAGTLDLLNPDYFVAWQNINRGDIDPIYMAQLSEDAIPALVTLVNAPEPGLRSILRRTLAEYRDRFANQNGDWRDFNIDHAAAKDVLDKLGEIDFSQPLQVDDFKNLPYGMTVREATRQFGFPMLGSNFQYEFSTKTNQLTMWYRLDDWHRIELYFDTAAGLTSATLCNLPLKGMPCEDLPIKK